MSGPSAALVLVIAKDSDVRDALRDALARAGYAVDAVASLKDAATHLHGPGPTRPAAAVVDGAPNPDDYLAIDALRDVPLVLISSGTGASLFTADVIITRGLDCTDSARAAAAALRELLPVPA